RHIGRDGRCGDSTCCRDRLLRIGSDASCGLRGRRRCLGNEILEAGIDPLVTDGGGIRYVARDVLQCEGLSLQTANRSRERVEDTHNVVSTFDPDSPSALPGRGYYRR